MRKETRKKQVKNMIYAAIKNLFEHQNEFSLSQFTVAMLESLMLLEREIYLKSHQGKEDSANGSYLRSFKSLSKNGLMIKMPRSRNGHFKPLMLELINQQKEQLHELALLMYQKGLSSRDVSYIMQSFFGESMSRETVNNLADEFQEIRKQWENRTLDAYYKAIFCDALFVSLRRGNSYSKEAVYIMYGVKEDNTRELILLELNPSESSSLWGEYFEKLKKRGVEQVDLIVADGLPYFDDYAKRYYPEADIQKCVVHLQRNILNKIRPKDKLEFSLDLKHVFNNFESTSTIDNVFEKIEKLKNKWGRIYTKILQKLSPERIYDYLTYIKYPVEVRRMIYTTNSIENLNRQIRRITKTKVSFENEDNLLNLVYMVIKDFELNNWQKYPVHNFKFWPRFTHLN